MKKVTKIAGALVCSAFMFFSMPVIAQENVNATTNARTADDMDDDDDDEGKWGLLGLLGLIGLAGLKRRDNDRNRTTVNR